MTIFLLVLHYDSGKQVASGGWSGIGKALSGIDPTGFGLYPTSIPPGVIVQKYPHLKIRIPLKHRVDFVKIMFLMSEDYNDDMPRSLRHSTYHHDP